ncbi:MAG: hypothetical protein KBC73_21515 [Burkholderiaceae bacterium]|nr:hypothetical protein [Burkholderiaceae bacterium]
MPCRTAPALAAPALRHAAALVAGALLLGLAGCPATAPTTVAPPTPAASTSAGLPAPLARLPAAPAASGPSARLLLRAAVPTGHHAVLVQLMEQEQCKAPHRLGSAAIGRNPPTALSLPAGQPVTLDFVFADANRVVCGLRWSFTPQSGRQYLVQGGLLGAMCPSTLTDVTQADRPRTPEDLRYRMEPGKPCVPSAQAKRVPPGMLEGGQIDGEAVLRPLATDEDLKGLITP